MRESGAAFLSGSTTAIRKEQHQRGSACVAPPMLALGTFDRCGRTVTHPALGADAVGAVNPDVLGDDGALLAQLEVLLKLRCVLAGAQLWRASGCGLRWPCWRQLSIQTAGWVRIRRRWDKAGRWAYHGDWNVRCWRGEQAVLEECEVMGVATAWGLSARGGEDGGKRVVVVSVVRAAARMF